MMRKRILGLLICLAMITAMMPQFVLAETSETTETQKAVTEEAAAEASAGEKADTSAGETHQTDAGETAEASTGETSQADAGETPEEEPDAALPEEEIAEPKPAAESGSEDEFKMTLPTVYLHINGGQAEVSKMNESEDHSYHCKGTMDIIVPVVSNTRIPMRN